LTTEEYDDDKRFYREQGPILSYRLFES
jgi:hypothetical protein